jgi:hypothetical protein
MVLLLFIILLILFLLLPPPPPLLCPPHELLLVLQRLLRHPANIILVFQKRRSCCRVLLGIFMVNRSVAVIEVPTPDGPAALVGIEPAIGANGRQGFISNGLDQAAVHAGPQVTS